MISHAVKKGKFNLFWKFSVKIYVSEPIKSFLAKFEKKQKNWNKYNLNFFFKFNIKKKFRIGNKNNVGRVTVTTCLFIFSLINKEKKNVDLQLWLRWTPHTWRGIRATTWGGWRRTQRTSGAWTHTPYNNLTNNIFLPILNFFLMF